MRRRNGRGLGVFLWFAQVWSGARQLGIGYLTGVWRLEVLGFRGRLGGSAEGNATSVRSCNDECDATINSCVCLRNVNVESLREHARCKKKKDYGRILPRQKVGVYSWHTHSLSHTLTHSHTPGTTQVAPVVLRTSALYVTAVSRRR